MRPIRALQIWFPHTGVKGAALRFCNGVQKSSPRGELSTCPHIGTFRRIHPKGAWRSMMVHMGRSAIEARYEQHLAQLATLIEAEPLR